MHEMDMDADTDTPRRKLGPGLSFARRGAIHLLFANTFGSPPEDSWGGKGGVAALIRRRLDIPSDSYRMIFRTLKVMRASWTPTRVRKVTMRRRMSEHAPVLLLLVAGGFSL